MDNLSAGCAERNAEGDLRLPLMQKAVVGCGGHELMWRRDDERRISIFKRLSVESLSFSYRGKENSHFEYVLMFML